MGTNDGTDEGNGGADAEQTGGQSTGDQSTGGQSGGGEATGDQAGGGQSAGGQPGGGQAAGGHAGGGHPNTQSGLEPNVAGALCYALGWLSGLFFYFTEEEDDFIRFHAAQSIVAFGALTVVYIVITQVLWTMLFSAGGFGAFQLINLLNMLMMLAGLGLWLGMMYVAYDGRWFELPIAGDIANDMISSSGGSTTVERKPQQ